MSGTSTTSITILCFLCSLHYPQMTTEPFSEDVFSSSDTMVFNALLDQIEVLQTTDDEAEKGDALVFILHLLGDIMQPFHVTQLVSSEYPEGDKGGLLYDLQHSGYRNLHLLSDNVGNAIKKDEVGLDGDCDG